MLSSDVVITTTNVQLAQEQRDYGTILGEAVDPFTLLTTEESVAVETKIQTADDIDDEIAVVQRDAIQQAACAPDLSEYNIVSNPFVRIVDQQTKETVGETVVQINQTLPVWRAPFDLRQSTTRILFEVRHYRTANDSFVLGTVELNLAAAIPNPLDRRVKIQRLPIVSNYASDGILQLEIQRVPLKLLAADDTCSGSSSLDVDPLNYLRPDRSIIGGSDTCSMTSSTRDTSLAGQTCSHSSSEDDPRAAVAADLYERCVDVYATAAEADARARDLGLLGHHRRYAGDGTARYVPGRTWALYEAVMVAAADTQDCSMSSSMSTRKSASSAASETCSHTSSVSGGFQSENTCSMTSSLDDLRVETTVYEGLRYATFFRVKIIGAGPLSMPKADTASKYFSSMISSFHQFVRNLTVATDGIRHEFAGLETRINELQLECQQPKPLPKPQVIEALWDLAWLCMDDEEFAQRRW